MEGSRTSRSHPGRCAPSNPALSRSPRRRPLSSCSNLPLRGADRGTGHLLTTQRPRFCTYPPRNNHALPAPPSLASLIPPQSEASPQPLLARRSTPAIHHPQRDDHGHRPDLSWSLSRCLLPLYRHNPPPTSPMATKEQNQQEPPSLLPLSRRP
jgi:hypothetical protein